MHFWLVVWWPITFSLSTPYIFVWQAPGSFNTRFELRSLLPIHYWRTDSGIFIYIFVNSQLCLEFHMSHTSLCPVNNIYLLWCRFDVICICGLVLNTGQEIRCGDGWRPPVRVSATTSDICIVRHLDTRRWSLMLSEVAPMWYVRNGGREITQFRKIHEDVSSYTRGPSFVSSSERQFVNCLSDGEDKYFIVARNRCRRRIDGKNKRFTTPVIVRAAAQFRRIVGNCLYKIVFILRHLFT